MMVIRGDLAQEERRALFDDNTLTGSATGVIFPADRCTWTYSAYDDATNTICFSLASRSLSCINVGSWISSPYLLRISVAD